jgi:hypothetical protein
MSHGSLDTLAGRFVGETNPIADPEVGECCSYPHGGQSPFVIVLVFWLMTVILSGGVSE